MKNKKIRNRANDFGDPKGTRTPDSAVRGLRLNHLTMGPNMNMKIIAHKNFKIKNFSLFSFNNNKN